MDFAAQLLQGRLLADSEIKAVQNMICCTGVEMDIARIPFQNEIEKLVGYALGTGDLLGQMAARDYIEKLPILFEEFAEAQLFSKPPFNSHITFDSVNDLMGKTPLFWESYVKPKIEGEFESLYKFLNDPYPTGPNRYLERIETNLDRLRQQLGESAHRG